MTQHEVRSIMQKFGDFLVSMFVSHLSSSSSLGLMEINITELHIPKTFHNGDISESFEVLSDKNRAKSVQFTYN